MAKQNFVAGGFYGKVGEFVGQRWKNIRTIRAYVIPHNPRTPLQQANRKFFSEAVPLAQMANSAYPHCPAFDTTENTQWAYRMSIAKLAIEAGLQDVATVPVFPRNFSAPFVVTEATVTEIVNTRQIKIEIQGTIPQEARNYSALFYFADGSREGEMIICSGSSTAATPNEILLECGETLGIDSSQIYCRVFSNDDKTKETIINCARIQLKKSLTTVFNTATDLEGMTLNDDGTIDYVFKTPNAYDGAVSGSVAANITLTSCTQTLKDNSTDTSTTGVFTAEASFANIDGSVGVNVKITPVKGAAALLNYTAVGNIEIAYTNAHTNSTTAASGSTSFDFKPTWTNKQPVFALPADFIQMVSATTASTDPQDGEFGLIVLMKLRTNLSTDAAKEWQNKQVGKWFEQVASINEDWAGTFRITLANPSATITMNTQETLMEGDERIAQDTDNKFTVSAECGYYEDSRFTENTRATSAQCTTLSTPLVLTIPIAGEYTSDTLPATEDFTIDLTQFLQSISV